MIWHLPHIHNLSDSTSYYLLIPSLHCHQLQWLPCYSQNVPGMHHFSAFSLRVPSAWNAPPQTPAWLTLSSSFKSLLQCHLSIEVFPDTVFKITASASIMNSLFQLLDFFSLHRTFYLMTYILIYINKNQNVKSTKVVIFVFCPLLFL